MKINSSIMFNIVIAICIIAFFTIVGFAVYDYNEAHVECLDFKYKEDCSYKVCMAKEYNSNHNMEKAVNCLLLYEHDALVATGEGGLNDSPTR